ncbi:TIGR02679 family protein [Streptomyces sp. WAC07061]|uniref:TIGR02679 family protein n=1 Tax=Streptomyces sp. WAC07061 TaxID=2487410 RepID=UPI0021AF2CA6|nr:TIGR02679 family protein [Streptomyces sp. WAC07061]
MELTAESEPPPVDTVRLRSLLGVPELTWLVERVRRRLAAEQPLTGAVTLTRPTPDQRRAVERLLGRAPGGGRSLAVRLEAVDAVLRRSGISEHGLAAAVTALTGPVALLGPARRAEEEAWRDAFAPIDELSEEIPRLAPWAVRLRGDGLVRRLAGNPATARNLLLQAATVLRALPADPAVSLPAFAARFLDSAHALDDGTPLATVTLSGLRAMTGFPDGSGAQWRRDAWASAGLLRDELSSTVLALNLRGTPALDWMADAGEPSVLTLKQLIRSPPASTTAVIHVCENPAVVAAAADAHGQDCSPLVCVQGQPSAAALALLRHLHEGGATVRYHGDFDWGGLRIASALLRRVPWQPWRFTAAEYRAAALTAAAGPPLVGRPAEAPWDPELAAALVELGVRVEEETVLDQLLTDLVPGTPRRVRR